MGSQDSQGHVSDLGGGGGSLGHGFFVVVVAEVVGRDIESKLSTRQRVQFRFFVERFRRDVQRKVQRLRQERGPPPDGARPGSPRQRP